MHKVHKSRTLRTIACFMSSTVLMNVDHVHVLRNANANVLHSLVHRCLSAIPNMHRFTSRRMRFKNTKVAIMSLTWGQAGMLGGLFSCEGSLLLLR